jgi:hypothetical protein
MNFPDQHFFEEFKRTNGALSCCEAIALANIAEQAPVGVHIELGSHKGKSSMSALLGLKGGKMYMVDPIFEDEEIASQTLISIYRAVSTMVSLELVADYSENVIEKYGPYSYVLVDSGSHQDGLPMREVRLLEDRVVAGGIIAFHDYNSQFIEVTEAYDYLLATKKYKEVKIDWHDIIDHVSARNLEAGNLSWHHQETKFPCFVGAVRRI